VTERGKRAIWVGFGVLVMAAAMVIALMPAQSAPRRASAPGCDPAKCIEPKCGPAQQARARAGECCPTCQVAPHSSTPSAPPTLDACAHQRCEPCPDGTREQSTEGQCCPSCLPIDTDACSAGTARYEARWAELESELRSCSAADDCIAASFTDACRATCPLPLNKQRLGSVVSRLQEEASVHCEACPAPAFRCPEAPSSKVGCVKGRCEYLTP